MGVYDRDVYEPALDETGWRDQINDALRRLANLVGHSPIAAIHGADGDGNADDTAAVQDTFGAPAVPGSGLVTRRIDGASATYRLTDTVVISGRSPIFKGAGIGNATDKATFPGEGTTFFWDGPAGQPMFVVEDSRHVVFEDTFFEGNEANPPSDLIFFDGTPHAHGSNELMYFNRCRFGAGFFSERTHDGIVCAENGVRFGGFNSNNDQSRFNDCVFNGCETGLYLPNSQSVWHWLSNVFFNRCTTVGLRTAANLLVDMLTVNDCAIDVQVDATAQVDINGWYSEGTQLLAAITGNSGVLRVRGGDILVPLGYAGDNLIEATSLGGFGGLTLEGLSLNDAQTSFVMPKIYVRGNNSSDAGFVSIRDCHYLELADLDIEADPNPVTGGIVCKIDVEEHEVRRWLGPGEALSTTVAPTVFTGPVVAAREQLPAAATSGMLHVPSFDGPPTGLPDTYDGTYPVGYESGERKLWLFDGDWLYFTGNVRLLSPADVGTVLAWYDLTDASTLFTDTARTTPVASDGDSIKGVTDKSGNGHHLSEASNAPIYKQAIRNGKDVARLNGTNQHWSDTSFPSSALPLTVFAIGNATNTALNKSVIDGVTSRVAMGPVGSGLVQAWAGGSVRTPNAVSVEGGWHEFHASIANAASSVFVGVDGTEAVDNSAGSSPLAGLRVGCDSTVGGSFFDGDLAHVVIVTGAMTSADRKALARWLGNEMNVTIS